MITLLTKYRCSGLLLGSNDHGKLLESTDKFSVRLGTDKVSKLMSPTAETTDRSLLAFHLPLGYMLVNLFDHPLSESFFRS